MTSSKPGSLTFAGLILTTGLLVAACQSAPSAPTAAPTKPAASAAATAPAATAPAATAPATTAPAAATTGAATKPAGSTASAATGAGTAAASPAGTGTAGPAATTAAGAATKPAAGATTTATGATSASPAAATGATSASPAAATAASPAAAGAAGRTVAIEERDFAFAAPDTIEGGWVTIQVKNAGQEPHHAQFARLKETTTLDQFLAELKKGQQGALPLVSLEGGAAAIGPGGSADVTLDLKAGTYVLLCFIPSRDGVPHLAKGMVKPLQVTAPTAPGTAPTPRGTVALKDFAFDVPDTLPAGKSSWRVANDGPQPHEAALVRLTPGKTVQDLVAFYGQPAGPPPGQSIGGMQGLDKGNAGFVNVDLAAGDYALICQIPDPASGKSHLALGMARGFSVR